MAPPTLVDRQPPAGFKMDDGFRSVITLEFMPDAPFWEKTVTPPGVDGGDKIDTNTMHNIKWRTMSPRQLLTMTEAKVTAAYDPLVYDPNALIDMVNVIQSITIQFSDVSAIGFWGFLQKIEFGDSKEGEQPEATLTIICTNEDPATGEEEGPIYQAPAVPGGAPMMGAENEEAGGEFMSGGETLPENPEPQPETTTDRGREVAGKRSRFQPYVPGPDSHRVRPRHRPEPHPTKR